jgi:hypothetical protein
MWMRPQLQTQGHLYYRPTTESAIRPQWHVNVIAWKTKLEDGREPATSTSPQCQTSYPNIGCRSLWVGGRQSYLCCQPRSLVHYLLSLLYRKRVFIQLIPHSRYSCLSCCIRHQASFSCLGCYHCQLYKAARHRRAGLYL